VSHDILSIKNGQMTCFLHNQDGNVAFHSIPSSIRHHLQSSPLHLTLQTPVFIGRWSFVKHPTYLQYESMRMIVRLSTAIGPWLFLTLDDLDGRWVTGY